MCASAESPLALAQVLTWATVPATTALIPPSHLGETPSPPTSLFVHCAFGRSRSASCLLAYLVLYRGLSLITALYLVTSRRPIVLPNAGFLACLVAMEEVCVRAAAVEGGGVGAEPAASAVAAGAGVDAGVGAGAVTGAGVCSVPESVLQLHPAALRKYEYERGTALRGNQLALGLVAARAFARAAAAAGTLPSAVPPID